MQNVNSTFLISLFIIALGYAAKRLRIVKDADGDALSRIVFNFTLPSTVIATFGDMHIDKRLFILPLSSILYGTLLTGIAFIVFRNIPRQEKGMLTMQFASFNIGLFAYPLVEAMWGKNGLKYFATFDLGNSLMLFVVAYIIARVHADEKGKINYRELIIKVFSSVPLLAYVITLLLILTHLSYPSFFLSSVKVIAKANMPLSLLLLGFFLSFSFEWKSWKRIIQILVIRYSIGITTGLILYYMIPLEPMFKITLLIGFSLPISLSVVPFAVECGYDKKLVGTINNATIIISFILMWVCVNLLQHGIL